MRFGVTGLHNCIHRFVSYVLHNSQHSKTFLGDEVEPHELMPKSIRNEKGLEKSMDHLVLKSSLISLMNTNEVSIFFLRLVYTKKSMYIYYFNKKCKGSYKDLRKNNLQKKSKYLKRSMTNQIELIREMKSRYILKQG